MEASGETSKARRRELMALTIREFGFLCDEGFELVCQIGPATGSFKDGFKLTYAGAGMNLSVQYYDLELGVKFHLDQVVVDFLFLDENFFGNESTFQGMMFPDDKLPDALHRVSGLIRSNYSLILKGDPLTWSRITARLLRPE